jgi:aspartate/methionine/tyrosine aminotransferase
LEAIAGLVQTSGATAIVDELYARLVYDQRHFLHFSELMPLDGRLIITLGPSKTESMSGYRVGVVVGPHWAIDGIEDVMGTVALRAPAYAQHTLVNWLASDVDFVRRRVTEYQNLRDSAVEQLNDSGLVSVALSGGTSYIFPRVVDPNVGDQQLARALKRRAGIVINPGYQFGSRGLGHFRICIAQSPAALELCLKSMIKVLAAGEAV